MPAKTIAAFFLLTLAGCGADYRKEGNLRYDRYPETVLDVLSPHDPILGSRPGVLVIHGGGWVSGSKEEMSGFYRPFLDRGLVVANIEYRLAGAAPAPAAVIDVRKAAQWFADNAEHYKVDPKRLIAVGSSAGGSLALLTGLAPDSAGFGVAPKIAAVVDFNGITDVVEQLEGPGMRDYAVQWLAGVPDRMMLAKKLSPLSYIRKEAPAVIAIHGNADPVVPYTQSVRLVNGLKQAGAKAELLTVAGGKHGFSNAEMAEIWPQVFAFLKRHKIAP